MKEGIFAVRPPKSNSFWWVDLAGKQMDRESYSFVNRRLLFDDRRITKLNLSGNFSPPAGGSKGNKLVVHLLSCRKGSFGNTMVFHSSAHR